MKMVKNGIRKILIAFIIVVVSFQSSFVCSLSFVKAATVMIFSCRQASLRDNVFGFLAISFSAPRTLDSCFQYSYLPLAQAVCYCTLV